MVFVSFMSACGTGASGRETAWSCSQIAGFSAEPPVFFDRNLRGERTTPSMARCWLSDTPQVATPIRCSAVQPTIGIGVAGTFTDTCGVTIGTMPVGEASRFSARRRTSLPISTGKTYSAACCGPSLFAYVTRWSRSTGALFGETSLVSSREAADSGSIQDADVTGTLGCVG